MTKKRRSEIITLLKKGNPISMVRFVTNTSFMEVKKIRDEEGIPKNKPEKIVIGKNSFKS